MIMTQHNDATRAFFHYARSWYARPGNLQAGYLDLVTFGDYLPDGSSAHGDVTMAWLAQGPRLEVFHDGWFALAGMWDVISTLGNLGGAAITPAAFCELLTALGFVDGTQTERSTRS
jgi:hypothetical protein